MKEYTKLLVTEMQSVSPTKIAKTVSVRRQYKNELGEWHTPIKIGSKNNENKLKKKFHNFEISINSQRNLRSKVEWLYQYAKPRNIKTYSNKFIKSFKCVFLTLTLPSVQKHPTAYLITTVLDSFLQQLRKRLKMNNYVWRLEFQANGNAHFHIVTDTYVDYYLALKLWNNELSKHGYIKAYQEKMNKMNFVEYQKRFGKNYKGEPLPQEIVFKRYENGKKTKWNKPNTVDVKNVSSGNNINYYISKYFSKKEKKAKKNKLDNEENSFALRLCFWSRSLSRCKAVAMPTDYYDVDFFELLKNEEGARVFYFDYCSVIYYEFSKLSSWAQSVLRQHFLRCRSADMYIPAG